jgi:tungstate transport system permease protein
MILEGCKQALTLLAQGDPELMQIVWLSLFVSGTALLLALLLGIPLGIGLAISNFPGRNFIVACINTGMALPPVLVGLLVYLFLWRSGPLGSLNWLYTPTAIIVAQVIIAFPVITGLSLAAVGQIPLKLRWQTLALGANPFQLFWTLMQESRLALFAALMAGFGSIISEVGAVMMVGGNLKGQTRVLTTALVLETRMGHFELAIALGLVLLLITFLLNLVMTALQQKGRPG